MLNVLYFYDIVAAILIFSMDVLFLVLFSAQAYNIQLISTKINKHTHIFYYLPLSPNTNKHVYIIVAMKMLSIDTITWLVIIKLSSPGKC